MERKISDLMDGIREDTLEPGMTAPLSARRIKEMTLDRIETKKPVRLNWVGRVAAAVAALMLLTVTVFAADATLGEGKLLGRFFGKELSQQQMTQAEDIGRDFGGGVHVNGTTITPIEAIADDHNLYLHLKVEAPPGVVLRDLDEKAGYYYDFEPSYLSEDLQFRHKVGGMQIQYYWDNGYEQWHDMNFSYVVTTLADPDPTDNVKEFVIRFNSDDPYAVFNGPWPKFLHIKGLFVRKQMETYCEEILWGHFVFDIGVNDENRKDAKLEVDMDDVTVYNDQDGFSTTISKLTITPLSITVEYKSTQANNSYVFPKGGPIQLVMKDGTVVEAAPAYYNAKEHSYPHPDSVVGVTNLSYFDDIIVVSQIDYILIGGEHKIDVN